MLDKNIVNALDMKEENPFYKKYLKRKDKFLKKKLKHLSKEEVDKIDYEHSDYYFLCFMTKKYFKDNILISLEKILIGICSIFILISINNFVKKGRWLKSIAMMAFLFYAIITIPLSILYVIANFICLCTYKDYITTRESVLAKKIIHFYASETDKFSAVNWKSVFKRDDYVYKERKRMRGW